MVQQSTLIRLTVGCRHYHSDKLMISVHQAEIQISDLMCRELLLNYRQLELEASSLWQMASCEHRSDS